jgi:MYXO-CTERM domain-containing protein
MIPKKSTCAAALLSLWMTTLAGRALAADDSSQAAFAAPASSLTVTSAASAGSALVFDNVSSFLGGAAGAAAASTSSTPNTFMGDGYTLLAGTTAITGFDLFPANQSGLTFTGLKINVFVWGTVNTGTVSAAAPAFSNLLGSYSANTTGSFASGFFFPIQGTPAGTMAGFQLASPLNIASTTIGLTVNYQGTTDGINYSNVNSLTSLITYGVPATMGSQVFNGYYRNANGENDGNFTSSLRGLGQSNQSLGLRVYGTVSAVPEASTWLMMLMGVGALALLRKRR